MILRYRIVVAGVVNLHLDKKAVEMGRLLVR